MKTNPTLTGNHAIIFDFLPKDAKQKAIISEMRDVLTHISEHQLAGYPEKLRKLAEKLTNS